jgi:hypothetical protein
MMVARCESSILGFSLSLRISEGGPIAMHGLANVAGLRVCDRITRAVNFSSLLLDCGSELNMLGVSRHLKRLQTCLPIVVRGT